MLLNFYIKRTILFKMRSAPLSSLSVNMSYFRGKLCRVFKTTFYFKIAERNLEIEMEHFSFFKIVCFTLQTLVNA
jgi:hypothetical protein